MNVGTILVVDPDRRGGTLVTGTAATDLVLELEDATDFDEAGGWLVVADSDPIPYAAVDDDAELVALTAPVGGIYEAGLPVDIWDPTVSPAGARMVEYLATVDTADGQLKALVPHELIPAAGVDNLEGASVELSQTDEGRWYVSQVYGREMVLDLSTADPESAPEGLGGGGGPTGPPAASPLPATETGPGAVIVRFTPTPDASTYDLYLAADSSATPDASTLWAEDVKPGTWVYTDQTQTRLPLDVDTSFAIVARNGTEAAAPSAWVPGRPGVIPIDHLTALFGSVIAQRLIGEEIEGVRITGSELEILNSITAREDYLSIVASSFEALAGVFRDSLTIQGQQNRVMGALELAAGVSAPTSKPTAASGPWEEVEFASALSASNVWGLTDTPDGTSWVMIERPGTVPQLVFRNKATGATSSAPAALSAPASSSPRGVVRIGSSYYVLIADSSRGGDWYIFIYNATTFAKTGEFKALESTSNANAPVLGIAGSDLMFGWITASNNFLRWRTYSTAGVELSDVTTSVVYNPADGTLRGIGRYTEAGTNYVWIAHASYNPLVYKTDGTWPGGGLGEQMVWYPAGTIRGMIWDGTRFWSHDAAKVSKYSQHLGGSHQYAYSQVDSDPGGAGTAETQIGPVLSATTSRFKPVQISTPPPDDDGTTDGANTVAVYGAKSGQPLKKLAEYVEGERTRAFDVISTSGAAPPASNGFAARASSSPGLVRSSKADGAGARLTEFRGDGYARVIGIDPWHTVGAAGEPGFLNGWSAQNEPVQFRKTPTGDVHLRGRAKLGTAATSVFTLPVGYRPTETLQAIALAASGDEPANVDITTAGAIIPSGLGSSTQCSLSGISFSTA